MFQFEIMDGHDALTYLPRSIEFYQGLNSGQVFPRWAADFGYGYGQPTFNFNPPVLYYLIAFFHLLGFSFIGAQNLALFAILALAGLGMYLLAEQAFGPRGGLIPLHHGRRLLLVVDWCVFNGSPSPYQQQHLTYYPSCTIVPPGHDSVF